jgi:hypothetical protein
MSVGGVHREGATASRVTGVFGHERTKPQRSALDAPEHSGILEPWPRDLHGDGLPFPGAVLKTDQREGIAAPVEQDRISAGQAMDGPPQPIEILKRETAAKDKVHGKDFARKNVKWIWGQSLKHPSAKT